MEERQEFGGELECVEDEIELAVSGGDLEFGRGLEFGGELIKINKGELVEEWREMFF